MKIKLFKPIYCLYVFFFLITIPYIYPVNSYSNNYVRFFTVKEHVYFVIIMLLITILGCGIVSILFNKNKINIQTNRKSNYFLLHMSHFMINISIIMNIIIVILAFKYVLSTGSFVGGRTEVFSKLKGINIISQFYIMCLPCVIYLEGLNKKNKNKILILFIFISLRSIFLPERLALLEFIIPLIIFWSINNNAKIKLRKVLILVFMIISFILLSQVSKDREVDYSGKEANLNLALENIMTYYADTSNKLYFNIKYNYDIESTTSIRYTIDRIKYRLGFRSESDSSLRLNEIIDFYNGRNKNMTNEGGLTSYYLDYGSYFIIAFLIHSMVLVYAYYKSINKSIFGIVIYPYIYLSILELPRFNYLYLTRFSIAFFVFVTIYIVNNIVFNKRIRVIR